MINALLYYYYFFYNDYWYTIGIHFLLLLAPILLITQVGKTMYGVFKLCQKVCQSCLNFGIFLTFCPCPNVQTRTLEEANFRVYVHKTMPLRLFQSNFCLYWDHSPPYQGSYLTIYGLYRPEKSWLETGCVLYFDHVIFNQPELQVLLHYWGS